MRLPPRSLPTPTEPSGRLALAGVGEGLAKRPLLAVLDDLAVETMAAPDALPTGDDGAVVGPCGGEVRFVADPFRLRVGLGERERQTALR